MASITYNFMESALLKRIKSFLWRAAMMGITFAVAWMADNIGMLEMSPMLTTVAGLVLGEVSKWLNNGADKR